MREARRWVTPPRTSCGWQANTRPDFPRLLTRQVAPPFGLANMLDSEAASHAEVVGRRTTSTSSEAASHAYDADPSQDYLVSNSLNRRSSSVMRVISSSVCASSTPFRAFSASFSAFNSFSP